MTHVGHGVAQPAGDDLGAVCAAVAQPLLQRQARGRQDEDGDALGHLGAHLARALPVDLEHDVEARAEGVLQRAEAGAVVVVEHRGVLEEGAVAHHLPEAFAIDEMIVVSVDFVRPLRARGVRDADAQLRLAFEQRLDEAGLAGARGRGDHEQMTAGHQRQPVGQRRARAAVDVLGWRVLTMSEWAAAAAWLQ